LTAALSLKERGVGSFIIEKSDTLGGRAAQLACKGTQECVRCDCCLAKDKIDEAKSCDLIERLNGVEITKLLGKPGDFKVSLADPGATNGKRNLRVGAVICAFGYEPFNPIIDRRLGIGESPDILTALELEKRINETGRLLVPSTGLAPQRVAFIQCVGSRDARYDRDYCSKACCKYAFKLAQLLKKQYPDLTISFFFMDWRLYDPRENVRLWAAGKKDVELQRSRPSEIIVEAGKPSVRFAAESDAQVMERSYDLVILSIGISPSSDTEKMAKKLGIERDALGFLKTNTWDPCVSNRAGIFLAGCCCGPKEIVESAKEGAVAAAKAYAFLGGRR